MSALANVDDKGRLLIIPCCARKKAGGGPWRSNPQAYDGVISKDAVLQVFDARKEILRAVTEAGSVYHEPKYIKNRAIKTGPDFGCRDISGEYMPAIERYCGTLYAACPGIKERFGESAEKGPHLLILSALYGPLHPLDCIQDYNLAMGERHAGKAWSDLFPAFLASFVEAFSIRKIELFLGVSTAYFRIAKRAVSPLIRAGYIRAIHHEVQNGNLRETPRNHGLTLARRLGGAPAGTLTREVITRKIEA